MPLARTAKSWPSSSTGCVPSKTACRCAIFCAAREADGCCWYDMVYNPQAVGMFRYLHSNPVEKSRAILRAVLATLEDKLYKPTAVRRTRRKIEKVHRDEG